MPAEYDLRSRYLGVALGARRVVDLLLPLVERNESQEALGPALTGLIASLELGANPQALLERLRAPEPSPLNEDLLADEELETPQERASLVQELRNVASDTTDAQARQASARIAIQLLCCIEGRALHFFSRSHDNDLTFAV